MYHYRICVRRGAGLEGVGDLSATDAALWGNKACMRSCFPPLNGVSMSLGPCVARRLSEVVDLTWPSCIISLLNHVGCVSRWLTSSTFTYTCSSRSLFLSQDHIHTHKRRNHCHNLNTTPPDVHCWCGFLCCHDLRMIMKQ